MGWVLPVNPYILATLSTHNEKRFFRGI